MTQCGGGNWTRNYLAQFLRHRDKGEGEVVKGRGGGRMFPGETRETLGMLWKEGKDVRDI